MKTSGRRICLVPRLSGLGGMVSFQNKLVQGLKQRGIEVSYDLAEPSLDAVLVIGGYKDLPGLFQARRRGIPIVQRLNGMNWLHRKRRTGLRHFLRAEYGNFVLSLIRSRLANRIVYQSRFSQEWWERVHGPTRIPSQIVYNGVNLERFSPAGLHQRPKDRFRLLLVEGTLGGGYEIGLETAVRLAESLSRLLPHPVELIVVGRVEAAFHETWQKKSSVPLQFLGKVDHAQIPTVDRSAHLLYSADINAACPNSVIEALGCGLPVAAFDTGALKELVTGDSGRVVAYGGDPWQLEEPDIPALAAAAADILTDQEKFRAAARQRAEKAFGLDRMVDSYLEALLKG
jgi:glycosyltransferase involved in cell wall biosynthesis